MLPPTNHVTSYKSWRPPTNHGDLLQIMLPPTNHGDLLQIMESREHGFLQKATCPTHVTVSPTAKSIRNQEGKQNSN